MGVKAGEHTEERIRPAETQTHGRNKFSDGRQCGFMLNGLPEPTGGGTLASPSVAAHVPAVTSLFNATAEALSPGLFQKQALILKLGNSDSICHFRLCSSNQKNR